MIALNTLKGRPSSPLVDGRWLQFSLIVIAVMTASYGRFTLGPIQEPMRLALGFSDTQIAILQGPAFALPTVFAAVPVGLLIDRFSRKWFIVGFCIIEAAGNLVTAFSGSIGVLFVSRAIVGFAVTAINTTAFSMVPDLCPPARRGRANTIMAIAQYCGMGAAFAAGGALFSSSRSWSDVVFWAELPLGLTALLSLALREPHRAERLTASPSLGATARELFQLRFTIAPLALVLVALELAIGASLVWGAPVLTRQLSMSVGEAGAVVGGAVVVSGVAGPVLGGLLSDLCHRLGGVVRTLGALLLLIVACGVSAVFATLSVPTWGALLFAFNLTALSASLVAALTLLSIMAPNELRGLCMAVIGAGQVVCGVGLAPVLVAWLAQLAGGSRFLGPSLSVVIGASCTVALAGTAMAIREARAHRRIRFDCEAAESPGCP